MNITKTIPTLLAVSMLATTPAAFAAVYTGALGNVSSATDFYLITCPDPTTNQLNFSVMNTTAKATTATPVVSGQVTKGWAALSTDDLTATDKLYGTAVNVTQGSGNYLLTVDKYNTGAITYSFNYTCQTKTGAATPKAATITPLQNQ